MAENARPKPRARARAAASSATTAALAPSTSISNGSLTLETGKESNASTSNPTRPDEDDDDDLFAYRRRMIRKLASQTVTTPSPPPTIPTQGSGSEQEDSGGKKRKRVKSTDSDWTRTGIKLALSRTATPDNNALESEDASQSPVVPVRASSLARSDHELLVSPSSATTDLPTTLPAPFQPDDDEDDEDDDFELPALDSVLMAKIQARHLTAKALSGSDVRFSGESSVNKKCQVMVQPRLDPKKARSMDENAKQKWMTKKAFDAPRGEPLTSIYETLGQVLDISSPTSNIVLELENRARIWSCYATPDSLNFPDPEASLLAYERTYYDEVQAERQEAERLRFEGRLADNERPPAPVSAIASDLPWPTGSTTQPPSGEKSGSAGHALASTEPIEIDSDSESECTFAAAAAHARADYSSDIEIVDMPPKFYVTAPTSRLDTAAGSEPPATPSSISVQIRGKEGELTGSVSATTTYDAVIKWYAGKMSIPVEMPATGRGKSKVPAKKLKIDFDGDLFDGDGKILDLDLDGGETLDIKYV